MEIEFYGILPFSIPPLDLATWVREDDWTFKRANAPVRVVSADDRDVFRRGRWVLAALRGPDSFGTMVMQTLYPIHRMLEYLTRAFPESVGTKANVLLAKSCRVFGYDSASYGMSPGRTVQYLIDSCDSWLEQFLPLMGMEKEHLPLSKAASRVCFEYLVLGAREFVQDVTNLEQKKLMIDDGHVKEFVDLLAKNAFGGYEPKPPEKYLTVVVYKPETKSRGKFTSRAKTLSLVEQLQRDIGGDVRAVQFDDMSIVDQIKLMRKTTLLITPGGGVGFAMLFLSLGSKVLVGAGSKERYFGSFLPACAFAEMFYMILLEDGDYDLLDITSRLKPDYGNSTCEMMNYFKKRDAPKPEKPSDFK